jgi:hypothetical protein
MSLAYQPNFFLEANSLEEDALEGTPMKSEERPGRESRVRGSCS